MAEDEILVISERDLGSKTWGEFQKGLGTDSPERRMEASNWQQAGELENIGRKEQIADAVGSWALALEQYLEENNIVGEPPVRLIYDPHNLGTESGKSKYYEGKVLLEPSPLQPDMTVQKLEEIRDGVKINSEIEVTPVSQ